MAVVKVKPKLKDLAEKYHKRYAYRVALSPKYAVIVISDTAKPKTRNGILNQLKNPNNVILRSKDWVVLGEKQRAYAVSKYLSYVRTRIPELWLTKKGAKKAATGARIAKKLEVMAVELEGLTREASVAQAMARLRKEFPSLEKANEKELQALAEEVLALIRKTEMEMGKKKV